MLILIAILFLLEHRAQDSNYYSVKFAGNLRLNYVSRKSCLPTKLVLHLRRTFPRAME
jgi:hypothetical protein